MKQRERRKNSQPSWPPGSFGFLEKQIRSLGSPKQVGDAFEGVCRFFLLNAPQYRFTLKKVWLWNKWPGRWGTDKGIDLVAETNSGELWAVQAKCLSPHRSVTKHEIDSFLSESNRKVFSYRLVLATTDDIGKNAREVIAAQRVPVGTVLRGQLLTTDLLWPATLELERVEGPTKTPRPHQREAIRKVTQGLKGRNNRGRLIMACGTGKTLTSLWIREELQARRTLVLVPSLSLIAQTVSEWHKNAAQPFDTLVVCSDETVSAKAMDSVVANSSDLGIPVTTSPNKIADFLSKRRKRPSVVFCTYQSSDRIAQAQRKKPVSLDLVLADESHRCVGPASKPFAIVLDETKIQSRKRLFITATPRYFTESAKSRAKHLDYELASMDDSSKFGPVLFQLTFDEAIRADLLCNYRVIVIGVTDAECREFADNARLVRTAGGTEIDSKTYATQIAIAKAMTKYDIRKMITFHSSIARSKQFTNVDDERSFASIAPTLMKDDPLQATWFEHISGKTPAGRRATVLEQFRELPEAKRAVLSNCQCLSEGVDIPELDGVAFVDPKRSVIGIVQAVGRVLRKSEGKRLGTILVPVLVSEKENSEAVLESSSFSAIWQVLRALRAHDSGLAEELDALRLKIDRSSNNSSIRLPDKIAIDFPRSIPHQFEASFYVRAVEQSTSRGPLRVDEILKWADAHFQGLGKWPSSVSGPIFGAPGESWRGVNRSLRLGTRGLPGDSSLAKLMAEHGRKRNHLGLPELSTTQILAWADKYFKREGNWPTPVSGSISGAPGETWGAVNKSLETGLRGLPGGSSIAKLLAENGRKRNPGDLPELSTAQILAWADDYFKREGSWPSHVSGSIPEAPGETWGAVGQSLQSGRRGLPSGSSIAKLLAQHGRKKNQLDLPELSTAEILAWVDEHFEENGVWPTASSGSIPCAPGETWSGLNESLRNGRRGFPGGSSLAKLLAENGRKRNRADLPELSTAQILAWADDHFKREGSWPSRLSGSIFGTPGENWGAVDAALRGGLRSLPDGSSIAKLLAENNRKRNRADLPELSTAQILAWADEHMEQNGVWPTQRSRSIPGAPGETWGGMDSALKSGLRGLSGGSSLAKLLAENGRKRNRAYLPKLSTAQILAWADEHFEQNGVWPSRRSGPISGAPGEMWRAVNQALHDGIRGLPGGSWLSGLLVEHGRKRNPLDPPELSTVQILAWADEHFEQNGSWPTRQSGSIPGAPGETWSRLNKLLRTGTRGLAGGSSIAMLLKKHRGERNQGDDS